MNRFFLIMFVFAFPSIVKSQNKCNSHFTIKVCDSLNGKSLGDATVILRTKKWSIHGYTDKHGIAKFNLTDSFKLDLKNQTYILQASLFMYHRRDSIVLDVNCKCYQKIYLTPWNKELIDEIKNHGYGTSPVKEGNW